MESFVDCCDFSIRVYEMECLTSADKRGCFALNLPLPVEIAGSQDDQENQEACQVLKKPPENRNR